MNGTTLYQDSAKMTSGVAAMLCFAFAAVLATFLLRPGLLDVVYFLSTVALGFWLFSKGSAWYLGWLWLLFFFSPFFRRVIDYELNTYSSPPLVLLSSLAVAFLCAITVFRFGKRLTEPLFRPHLLALVVIGYGFLVAIPYRGVVTATEEMLKWMVPVMLSFHILIFRNEYEEYKEVIRNVFMVGIALMGLYGIYQYYYLPGWDINWMVNSEMASIGNPRPQEVRVFSTLNSPGPFGMIMMAGLLLLFEKQTWLRLFVALPGYAGWALGSVRTSWIGWLFGMTLLLIGLRGTQRVRLATAASVVLIVCVPVFTYLAISDRFVNRATTLAEVQDDGSFQGRTGQYLGIATILANAPLGNGLGSIYYDSGFITAFHQLGLLGFVYLYALVLLVLNAKKVWLARGDPFAKYAWAVGATMFFLMLGGSQQIGVSGCVMWGFLSLAIVGRSQPSNEA